MLEIGGVSPRSGQYSGVSQCRAEHHDFAFLVGRHADRPAHGVTIAEMRMVIQWCARQNAPARFVSVLDPGVRGCST